MEVTVARGLSSNGTPLFTCNTCGLSFPTADLQRQHMKTEWHRYNLKRRVAQLPPISAEVFAEKILMQQAQVEDSESKRGGKQRKRQVTKKDKRMEEKQKRREALNKAAESHESDDELTDADTHSVVSSTFSLGEPVSDAQKHGDFTDTESLPDLSDSETAELHHNSTAQDEIDIALNERLRRNKAIPPNVCFMTDKVFDTVEENATHMLKEFGMFIPEREYLIDLDGLMKYLGEKVGLGNMCLYCGFEARSLEAIRAHMSAKRHIKIPYEKLDDKLEISDFYDFTSSYSKPSARDADDGEADEWEDLSGDEGAEDDDDDDIPDDYYAPVVSETGLELAMGNLRAGHRSLARYYRQNLHSDVLSEDQGTLIAADRRINNLVKPRDPVREKLQKQAFKEFSRKKNQERRREGKTINHQAHFRDQLLQ